VGAICLKVTIAMALETFLLALMSVLGNLLSFPLVIVILKGRFSLVGVEGLYSRFRRSRRVRPL